MQKERQRVGGVWLDSLLDSLMCFNLTARLIIIHLHAADHKPGFILGPIQTISPYGDETICDAILGKNLYHRYHHHLNTCGCVMSSHTAPDNEIKWGSRPGGLSMPIYALMRRAGCFYYTASGGSVEMMERWYWIISTFAQIMMKPSLKTSSFQPGYTYNTFSL